MNRLLLAPWTGLAACETASEGGGAGDTDTEGATETDTGTEPGTVTDTPTGDRDSCTWVDRGVCFEYLLYPSTEAWCTDIGLAYGVETEYMPMPCRDGAVATCELPAGGDLQVPATLYYYEDFSSDPVEECENAGGAPG
jgi:hypothetical protein